MRFRIVARVYYSLRNFFSAAGQLSGRLQFFLQDRTQFCRTVLHILIVILVIFAKH